MAQNKSVKFLGRYWSIFSMFFFRIEFTSLFLLLGRVQDWSVTPKRGAKQKLRFQTRLSRNASWLLVPKHL